MLPPQHILVPSQALRKQLRHGATALLPSGNPICSLLLAGLVTREQIPPDRIQKRSTSVRHRGGLTGRHD
eukprot:scaffold1492_cov257-Pinguiococcus_pyrenoidosus.AAC.18